MDPNDRREWLDDFDLTGRNAAEDSRATSSGNNDADLLKKFPSSDEHDGVSIQFEVCRQPSGKQNLCSL